MKPDWILIANATHARLLRRESGGLMVVLETFEHPESRSKVSDLADDRAGHESRDSSFGGSAYPPRVDAKQKEHARFARKLADHLERQAQQGSLRSLVIFASNPFLGEIKAELGEVTTRLLSTTHDLDLTSFGLTELEQRVRNELRPAAR